MNVASAKLVFDEVIGLGLFTDLADCRDNTRLLVPVTDSRHQLGSGLRQVAHHDAVMVSTWCFKRHLFEEWMIQVGDLEQFHVRSIPKWLQERAGQAP